MGTEFDDYRTFVPLPTCVPICLVSNRSVTARPNPKATLGAKVILVMWMTRSTYASDSRGL